MSTALIPLAILAAAVAPAGAPPAQATTAAPDVSRPGDQSTIVVTGQRVTEKTVRDFVKALTPVPFNGQISRFELPVCPVVSGLPAHQADAVASRIRQVAQAIGIRVGGAGCTPSVAVIVTGEKQAFLKSLKRYRPDYFGDLASAQIHDIFRQPGPAAAWHLQGPMLNASGVEINFDPGAGMYVNRTTDAGSRLTAAARPQFDSAVVVVERRALAGLTVTQLADYAAMRAFANVDPSRLAGPGGRTILQVLDAPMGSEVPITLTSWDLGFLRGLYSAPRNLATGAQRTAISKIVTSQLEGKDGKDAPADPPRSH